MVDPQDFDKKQPDANQRRRTAGRELAMKLVYLMDIRSEAEVRTDLNRILGREKEHPESEAFAVELFMGVAVGLPEIDEQIAKTADNWDVSRMASVDRALIRVGTFELMYRHDVPPKVAISEAIELAKRYSTDKSSSFVNGILDRIFQNVHGHTTPVGASSRDASAEPTTMGENE